MNWHPGPAVMLLSALAGCSSAPPEASIEIRVVEAGEVQLLSTDPRFESVRDLVLTGGSLWVLDGAPPFVTRVSVGDGEAEQFGRGGQGPGEFLNPWAIQPTAGPETIGIRVWDLGNNRVSTLDTLGNLVGSERLSDEGRIRARTDIRDVSYADPFRVRKLGTDVVVGRFPRRIDRTGDLVMGSLQRADDRLEPGPELARFADHMAKGSSSLREWAAIPFWDVCDETVVLWSPASAEVVWLDLQGEVRAAAPVEETSAPLSLEDIEAYLGWMARLEIGPGYEEAGINYTSMAKSYRDRFAERRPFATDLRCQSEEVAWLRRFDTSSNPLGRGQSWLKVSTDGTRQEVSFPVEFTPVVFTKQGAYGLFEAPEGYQRLAWWSENPAD